MDDENRLQIAAAKAARSNLGGFLYEARKKAGVNIEYVYLGGEKIEPAWLDNVERGGVAVFEPSTLSRLLDLYVCTSNQRNYAHRCLRGGGYLEPTWDRGSRPIRLAGKVEVIEARWDVHPLTSAIVLSPEGVGEIDARLSPAPFKNSCSRVF